MAGYASNPIRVTTAPTIPEAVEKTAHVTSAAIAIDPGRLWAAICKDLKSLPTISARSTT